jgi:hypothetical protein
VADAYLKIAEEHPERFVVVDADRDPAEVFDAVREAIERALEREEDIRRPNAVTPAGGTTAEDGPRDGAGGPAADGADPGAPAGS